MGKEILILSPQNDFSELLRLSLEENGLYNVYFAQSVGEVLEKIQEYEFVLVILDAEAIDQPMVSTAETIQGQVPGLPLVVIPPQNNSEHPSLVGYEWDGFISRPFFKPDLLDLVNDLTLSFEEQTAQERLFSESASEEGSELSLEEELELLMSEGGVDVETPTEASVSVPEAPPYTVAEQLLHELQEQLDPQAAPEGGIPLEDGEGLSLEDELGLLFSQDSSNEVEPKKELEETLPQEIEIIEDAPVPSEPSAQSSGTLTADENARLFEESSQKEAQTQTEPDEISEGDVTPEDVLESVMSQLDSQAVTQDDEELSALLEEELSKTPAELEETAVISLVDDTDEVTTPDHLVVEPATEIADDLLEGVISQIESQSIPDLEEEFEQLSTELELAEGTIEADEDTGTAVETDIADEPASETDETPEIPVPQMETQTVPDQIQEDVQTLPDKTEISIESEIDQLLFEEDTPVDDAAEPDSVLQDILAQLEKQAIPESEEDTLKLSEEELTELEAEAGLLESEVPEHEELETEALEEMTGTFQEVLDQAGAGAELGETDTQDFQELPEPQISELLDDSAEPEEPVLEHDTEELLEPEPSQQVEEHLEEVPEEEGSESVISQLDSQAVDHPDDDLSEKLEEELSESVIESVPVGEEVQPHILDEEKGEIETIEALRYAIAENNLQLASQNLSILMIERSAHAASIAKSGIIWAQSEDLSLLDIQEIENVLAQGQQENNKIDLARFIRLGEEQNKYLFYATTIRDNIALCMIYESTKQLSRIRSTTIEMARALAKRKLDEPFIPTPTVREPELATSQESGTEFDREEEDVYQKTLDELLAEMPPSDPVLKPASGVHEWVQEIPESEPALDETTEIEPSTSQERETEDELLDLLEAELEDEPEPEPVDAGEKESIILMEDEPETPVVDAPEIGEFEPEIEPSVSQESETEDELLDLLEAELEDEPEPEPVGAIEKEPVISAEDEMKPSAFEAPEPSEIEPEIEPSVPQERETEDEFLDLHEAESGVEPESEPDGDVEKEHIASAEDELEPRPETGEIEPEIEPSVSQESEDELLDLLEAELEDEPETEPIIHTGTEPIISAEDELELAAMETPGIGEIEHEIVSEKEGETTIEMEYAGDMGAEEITSEPEPVYTITQKTGYGWFTNKAYLFNKDELIRIEKDFESRLQQYTAPASRIPIDLDEESLEEAEPHIDIKSEQEAILIKTGAHLINQFDSPDKGQLFEFQMEYQYGSTRLNVEKQTEKILHAMEPEDEKYIPFEYPAVEIPSVEQDQLEDQVLPVPDHPEGEAIAEMPAIIKDTIETIKPEQDDESEIQTVEPISDEDILPPDPFVLDFEITEDQLPDGKIDETYDRAETIFEEPETLDVDREELDGRLQSLLSSLETKPQIEETDDFTTEVDERIMKEGDTEEIQDTHALLESAAGDYFKKKPSDDLGEDDEVLFLDEDFDLLSLGQKPDDLLSTSSESEPEKMLDFFLSEVDPLDAREEIIEQPMDAPSTGIEAPEASEFPIPGLEERIPEADQLPEQPVERESVGEEVVTTLHGLLSQLEAEADSEPLQADAKTDTTDIKPIESIDTDTTLIADTLGSIKLDESGAIDDTPVEEAVPDMKDLLEGDATETELAPAVADEGSILSRLSPDQPQKEHAVLPEESVKPGESQRSIPGEPLEGEEKEQKIDLDQDMYRMLIELNVDLDDEIAKDEIEVDQVVLHLDEEDEKIEPSTDTHSAVTEEIDPQSIQDDEDPQSVIIDVLSQLSESEADDESIKSDQIVEKSILSEPTDPDAQSVPLILEIPTPLQLDEEMDQLITEEDPNMRQAPPLEIPSIDPDQAMLLDDSILPWEKEGFDSQSEKEITPTISAGLEEENTQDVLLEMLAETQTEPISLSPDFPIYTCILVPELSEYRLSSKITRKLKMWVPQLCMAFGWQLKNLLIQPTYMQWTVRVPHNTSQGTIVRKIRQRTSYRLFYEFPDLIGLSQTTNFWANGYLVVSGNEPPTPEYLDDFIRKNRRPKGLA
jgi:REP element-mobilizing transposase RayT